LLETPHQDLVILGVGYLWEVVVVIFLMGVEDDYEGGINLWEEVVDLQVKANP
jgi:hypothetical protein